MEKKIEVCDVRVGDLHDAIGNPRKIRKAKKEELKQSLDEYGDFGIYTIDEDNNILGGHQRADILREEFGEDHIVHCKRLIGYTLAEKRAINVLLNTHHGEWDLNKLAEWTGDLNVKLQLDMPEVKLDERKIKDMEPVRFEKYNYVLVVCKNVQDYDNLLRCLELEDARVVIGHGKKGKLTMKSRAIWYGDFKERLKKNKL